MTTAPRTHSRLVLLIGALVALLAIAPACEIDDDEADVADVTGPRDTGNTTTNPSTASVGFDGASMNPGIVTIRPGGSVTFNNNAADVDMRIDFSDADTSLDSPDIVPGNSYEVTFNSAGTFDYNEIYSGAAGSVVVQ